MTLRLGAALGAAAIALGACAPTVETERPATVGATEQRFWVEEVATGLRFPASIAWLPNGDALVAERQGGLRLLSGGRLDPEPIAGVPPSFQNSLNGLKEVVVDPGFASNGLIYLLMSQGTYEAHYASVYRARLQGRSLSDVQQIFRSKDTISGPSQIAGRMALLKDGTLAFAVTDDNYHKRLVQDLSSHVGKMLRINRDGSIPQDNPFRSTPGALPEIWTLGHRTPNGLYEDPESGALFESEAGPKGGDELNRIERGHNYGWPNATWGFDYSSSLAGPLQVDPASDQPLLVWTPSVTPAGIARYDGRAYPFWSGSYFVGTLTGRALERVRLEDGKVVLRERLLLPLGERIRDVRVGPDDRLYLLTDHNDGRVLRLVPGEPKGAQLARVAHKLTTPATNGIDTKLGDPAKGETAFKAQCAACHSVGTRVPGGDIGPDLETAYGRQAGTLAGYSYSAGMAKLPQTWDLVSLDVFLAGPDAYVPGTTMTAPPVADRAVRMDIAAFLNRVAGLEGRSFGGPNTVKPPASPSAAGK